MDPREEDIELLANPTVDNSEDLDEEYTSESYQLRRRPTYNRQRNSESARDYQEKQRIDNDLRLSRQRARQEQNQKKQEDKEANKAQQKNNNKELPKPQPSVKVENKEEKSSNPFRKLLGLNKKKDNKVKTEGKVKLSQTLFAFLKKNPYVLAIIAIVLFVIIVLFIAILFFFFKLGGSSSTSRKAVTKSKTTTQTNYSQSYTAFNIKQTHLEKQAFREFIMNYPVYSVHLDAFQKFRDNADLIYDLATENNINPEIVIVRAVAEGFSPGESKNNYWGINCFNTGGYAACSSFDSFADGVLGFINTIKDYESTEAMMSRYSYIGDYWYNPGSSSLGGCHMYPLINQYMTAERSAQVAEYCDTSKTCYDSDCVPTIPEDQQAYTKWQVANMTKIREQIFGIGAEPVVASSNQIGNRVIWAQWDSRWAGIHLGNSAGTIGNVGCAVTSIAMGITGVNTNLGDDFNPGTFVQHLNSKGCFTSSGGIYWMCEGVKDYLPNFRSWNSISTLGWASSDIVKQLKSYDDNTFMLLHIPGSSGYGSHYVLFNQDYFNGYEVFDPGTGTVHVLGYNTEVREILVYQV